MSPENNRNNDNTSRKDASDHNNSGTVRSSRDEFSNRPYSGKRNLSFNHKNANQQNSSHQQQTDSNRTSRQGQAAGTKSQQYPPDINRQPADDQVDVLDLFYSRREARKKAQSTANQKGGPSHNMSGSADPKPTTTRAAGKRSYQRPQRTNAAGEQVKARSKRSSPSSKRVRGGGQPPHKKGPRKPKVLKTILKVVLIAIIAVAAVLGIWTAVLAKDLPEVTPALFINEQSSLVYDKDGEIYSSLHSGENRISVSLDEMPDYLIDCFISTEDARFYDHHGIDVIRIFGALKSDITSGSLAEGASTITMQLARNAILEDQSKQFTRKIKEALLALKIEKVLTKDEILYYYLNEIYFGPGANGIQLGAQLYFGKDVSELTLGEAAMLTGIVRNVKVYSPFNDMERATKVRNTVLDNLAKYKPEYQEQANTAKAEELKVVEKNTITSAYKHPWFTDYVIDQAEDILQGMNIDTYTIYNGGLHIYTTLDQDVQEAMEDVYADNSYFPSSGTNDPVQSSMLVIDPSTGEIRGLVGGREYTTQRGYNRATDLKRQPGSTIKPLVDYAPALEAGYSPATVYNDVPTSFGSYSPANYDGRYRGLISMRTAIMHSINIPAVKTLQSIGTSAGYSFGKKLGLPLTEDDNNLSLALGGIHQGLAPLHMAAAYAAFDNQGLYIEPHCITLIKDSAGTILYEARPDSNQAMSAQTAYLITDMLVSTTQSGTGTNAKMNRPVASKTGTTQLPDKAEFAKLKGNKDAWFAAYTPELVGVVWMGYDNEKDSSGHLQYLKQIYGGKYPALIWKKVMTVALSNTSVSQFAKPDGLTEVSIDKKSGLLPGGITPAEYIGTELFNSENVPAETSNIWTMVDICPESGKLATAYCPNSVSKARINLTRPAKAEDLDLYMPSTTCTVHNQGNSKNATVTVSICTDPSHGGQEYLANIATAGASGGCPSSMVKSKTYAVGKAPTEYCNIAGHAITMQTSGEASAKALSVPSGLKSTVYQKDSSTTVKLNWSDNNSSSTVAFIIEKTDDGGNKSKFSTYSKSLLDTTAEAGHTYQYRIRAYDNASKAYSDWSSSITVTT